MEMLNPRTLNLALGGALNGIAVAALAATVLPGFTTADSNHDGFVSPQEFAALGGREQAFHAGDGNHDLRLNNDEYAKAVANNDRIQAGRYADDAWITAKVKTLLLKDAGVKGLDVNVETHQGTVQLSGWVNAPTQIAAAEKLARSVEGVTSVRNDLQLKR